VLLEQASSFLFQHMFVLCITISYLWVLFVADCVKYQPSCRTTNNYSIAGEDNSAKAYVLND
jgi:hypothetical protein